MISINSFRLHARRPVSRVFHFNDDESRYFASRDCCLVLTNRVIFHIRVPRGEGKEKERNWKNPEKTFAEGSEKSPRKENTLSRSRPTRSHNEWSSALFSFFSPPFTWPDATRPIPFACRRLLVCFFSPSFPSETSSADPSDRESSSFDSSGDQGAPPVKQNICPSLKFVSTVNSGLIIPRKYRYNFGVFEFRFLFQESV